MLSQFLAERAAVQAEHGCGMTLIVLRVLKHGPEKRLLDLSLHHFIQLGASLTFEGFEKVPDRFLRTLSQGGRGGVTALLAFTGLRARC